MGRSRGEWFSHLTYELFEACRRGLPAAEKREHNELSYVAPRDSFGWRASTCQLVNMEWTIEEDGEF